MNAQRDLWLPPIEDRPPSGYAYSLMGIVRSEAPPLRESYLRYAYVRVTPTGPRDPGQSRYRMPLYFPELWPEHDGRPYTLGYDLSWSIPRCDMCHPRFVAYMSCNATIFDTESVGALVGAPIAVSVRVDQVIRGHATLPEPTNIFHSDYQLPSLPADNERPEVVIVAPVRATYFEGPERVCAATILEFISELQWESLPNYEAWRRLLLATDGTTWYAALLPDALGRSYYYEDVSRIERVTTLIDPRLEFVLLDGLPAIFVSYSRYHEVDYYSVNRCVKRIVTAIAVLSLQGELLDSHIVHDVSCDVSGSCFDCVFPDRVDGVAYWGAPSNGVYYAYRTAQGGWRDFVWRNRTLTELQSPIGPPVFYDFRYSCTGNDLRWFAIEHAGRKPPRWLEQTLKQPWLCGGQVSDFFEGMLDADELLIDLYHRAGI